MWSKYIYPSHNKNWNINFLYEVFAKVKNKFGRSLMWMRGSRPVYFDTIDCVHLQNCIFFLVAVWICHCELAPRVHELWCHVEDVIFEFWILSHLVTTKKDVKNLVLNHSLYSIQYSLQISLSVKTFNFSDFRNF